MCACQRPEPLTAAKAAQIVSAYQFKAEPIYAEVPQRVWWSARMPRDDFDEKSLRTFENLKRAGLITVSGGPTPDGASFTAKVTDKGFPILGTAPSHRGAVYRGLICQKRYDGIRGFERHPTQPTVGHAELVWHYAVPTPLYGLFETKINKPLDKPFASLLSFYYKDHQWRVDVMVAKTESQSGGAPTSSR
ncbi:MAG: hypothetical protein ABIP63_07330 [Thermoanaerobaculia bacterium]